MATDTKTPETRLFASGVTLIVRSDRGDVRLTVGRFGEVDGIDSRMDRFAAVDLLEALDVATYQATGPDGDGSLFLTDKARKVYAPLLAALDATTWETWA